MEREPINDIGGNRYPEMARVHLLAGRLTEQIKELRKKTILDQADQERLEKLDFELETTDGDNLHELKAEAEKIFNTKLEEPSEQSINEQKKLLDDLLTENPGRIIKS